MVAVHTPYRSRTVAEIMLGEGMGGLCFLPVITRPGVCAPLWEGDEGKRTVPPSTARPLGGGMRRNEEERGME